MVISDKNETDVKRNTGKYKMFCAQFKLCILYIFSKYIKLSLTNIYLSAADII